MLGAKRLYETIAYPALIHCKSGADRAGIMSVFYMHFRKGLPIREALDQLHLRYLHIKQGKTGVLDYVFERYLAEGEPAGMSFLEWVESPMYDPAGMKADFRAGMLGSALTEKLLPLAVTVPAELVPSPQLMVAVNCPAVASGLPSVKLATFAVMALPRTALKEAPVAEMAASATVAMSPTVAALPPASPIETLTASLPTVV